MHLNFNAYKEYGERMYKWKFVAPIFSIFFSNKTNKFYFIFNTKWSSLILIFSVYPQFFSTKRSLIGASYPLSRVNLQVLLIQDVSYLNFFCSKFENFIFMPTPIQFSNKQLYLFSNKQIEKMYILRMLQAPNVESLRQSMIEVELIKTVRYGYFL